MPLYEVALAAPLSLTQKTELAEMITKAHVNKFQIPRWYVNVVFTDVSLQTAFVGGKPKRFSNRITARVRNGGARSSEDFSELCKEIHAGWHQIVHPNLDHTQLPARELELAAVFITGELLAGMKVGFPVPKAGNEQAWAKEHYQSFKRRANMGDEDFIGYVAELEKKPGFDLA